MNFKTTLLSGVAAFTVAFASAPTTADALSVEFYEGGVLVDSATSAGTSLVASAGLSTGAVAINVSTVQNYPTIDQLLSTFNLSGSILDVVVRVTHNFDNDLPVPVLGFGSANNNFVGGADVLSEVFIGDGAYDMGTLVASQAGSSSVTNTGTTTVTSSDYWITQVLTVNVAANGGTSTTEWVAPSQVPLPAGIILLGTALGGLGFARRRNAKKA